MGKEPSLRLALDLGTTTLAGRLIDGAGAVLAEAQVVNPQRQIGLDIVRRLEAAHRGEAARLQTLLGEGVEALLARLLAMAGCDLSRIAAAAAAGNPGICHLLCRQPVERLLFPPYRPAFAGGELLPPQELPFGLPVPLYLFPLISGYVGGDLVAFLLSQSAPEATTLFLDIGTNGEMALHHQGRWHVTSVAAGPAFEGGEISCGMNAGEGAVCGVRLEGESLHLQTLDGGPPRGLCGSGLVEALAAALEGGLIDRRGRIADPHEVETNLCRYLGQSSAGAVLRLYRDAAAEIVLSQEDVRSFQLAKGAVRAGVECLLRRAGVAEAEVAKVVISGALGVSLDLQAVKRVAMLPPNMVDRVRLVGGGVLAGLCRFLRDPQGPVTVRTLAAALRPYPLSGTPAFEKAFLAALDF